MGDEADPIPASALGEPERRRAAIGRRIRDERRRARLTQRELADRLGVRMRNVEQIESGRFDDEELERVAAALGQPLSLLLGEDAAEPPQAPERPGRPDAEVIRLLSESRAAAGDEPSAPTRLEAATRRAVEFRIEYDRLLGTRDDRTAWRRVLARESDRELDTAVALLRRAVALQDELSRLLSDAEEELAATRRREERLCDALSAAIDEPPGGPGG